MMDRFTFFEKGFGLIAVKLGAMSPNFLWKYDLYKTYLSFLHSGLTTEEARKKTVTTHNEEYLNVARAIYWFEREGWTQKKHFQKVENKVHT